jgi:hypothetical protein
MRVNWTPVKYVSVDCSENDSNVGFDFYVPYEWKAHYIREVIEAALERHGLPCVQIQIHRIKYMVPQKRVWTVRKINTCVKKGY